MRVYVDSSALLKRVFAEPETRSVVALLERYAADGAALATSSLAWVEVSRAVRTQTADDAAGTAESLVEIALSGLLEKPLTPDVVALARRLHPPVLRSLDALHLSSALLLDADSIVTYDARLAAAAAHHGIPVQAPSPDAT